MRLTKGGRGAIVLVCGKCSKKVGGGFGKKGQTSLAKALRAEDGFGKGRKSAVQVTETKCLGLCPKGAVTVVDPRDPLKWLVVEPGEDVGEVAARLLQAEAPPLQGRGWGGAVPQATGLGETETPHPNPSPEGEGPKKNTAPPSP